MKKYICILGFLSALLFTFGSCTDFFSTSLASWAARDPKTLVPPVKPGNVDELVEVAQNNPDLSLEVLKGIKDAVKGANASDAAKLQSAALEAAANASGLGVSLLNQISNIAKADYSAVDIIIATVDGMSNLNEAASILEEILPTPGTTEWDTFVAKASPEDLATASIIIIMSETKKAADSGDYLENLTKTSDQEELAFELAIAAEARGMEGSFNKFLQELKLLNAGP